MSFPDDKPLGYYWSGSRTSLSINLDKFDDWCEDEDLLFKLPFVEQSYSDSDPQEAENLITEMKSFLNANCEISDINSALLGKNSLTYQNCKYALWILKNSNGKFIVLDSETDQNVHSFQDQPLRHFPKFAILKDSLYSLIRYTKVLKSNKIAFLHFNDQNSSEASTSLDTRINSIGRSLLVSQNKFDTSQEKSCCDSCTLF